MNIGIITGASSGLGEEFALRAFNIIEGLDELWLIARRADRLRVIADKLPGRKVRILDLDLADTASFHKLDDIFKSEKPNIRLLVNCAGLGILGDFEKVPVSDDIAMCDVNIRALTVLSSLTIPYMTRGSMIIMISSIASFVPTPRMSVYCSTKAYVTSLSKSLRAELKPRGINVLAVNPCPMDTEFLAIGGIEGNSKTFAMLPRCKPDRVAEVSLRRAAGGRGMYTPLAFFKFYRILSKLLPHNFLMNFSKV